MKKIFIFVSFVGIGLVAAIGVVSLFLKIPTVSVVMATYNRETFLPKAIESILAQSYPDFELIIVNDGSTDKTAEILRSYANQDSRIKIVQNVQNKGLIYSLNRGLSFAKGKYIARMDDDDISLPQRLERQVEYLQRHPDVSVLGSWFRVKDSFVLVNPQKQTEPESLKIELLLGDMPLSHPSLMIRHDFLTRHQIAYRETEYAQFVEDRWFLADVIQKGGKIASLKDILLEVRIHATNPKKYYEQQKQNVHFFQKYMRLSFLTPADLQKSNCRQLRQIVLVNQEKKQLSEDLLKQAVAQRCSSFVGEMVYHPYWEDAFIFNKNRVCREKKPTECAEVSFPTEAEILVRWDNWPAEIFYRDTDGAWILKKN